MEIEQAPRGLGRVGGVCAFTFDDGPDPIWTPHVLAELDRCGVKATFFMVGERVERAPGLARAVAERGHDVELHCHRHIRHIDLTDRELRDDTRAVLATFARAELPRPARWRAPWGICTEATERVATELELELVHWSADTHDWRGDAGAEMLEAVDAEIEDGAIVLMHDGLGPGALRAGVGETVELIGSLSELAQERGLRVLPLSLASTARAGGGLGIPI
jgi:peptidoglycan/xylan/chitin deacetylase (PgdA/CDA1 family)